MNYASPSSGGVDIGLLAPVKQNALGLFFTIGVLLAVTALLSRLARTTSRQPPSLSDPIPYVYNTLQMLLDNDKFMQRVKQVLKQSTIAKFHQGPQVVYLISGAKNVQTIFSRQAKVNNDGVMLSLNLPVWYRFRKEDLRRFSSDRSGRSRNPLPGTETTPLNQRYFHGYEHVHGEYLTKPQYVKALTEHYHRNLLVACDNYRSQEWETLSVRDLCRQDITKANILALLGPQALERSPELVNALWEFDEYIIPLALRVPRWLYSRPQKAHQAYLDAIKLHLDAAQASFDWGDSDSLEAPWEPEFGARVAREVPRWFQDAGFISPGTVEGALGILTWAQNSNLIPTLTWAVMEVCADADLIKALREEVETTYHLNHKTGGKELDVEMLTALPLLTSVYTETLRLHMSFNVLRNVEESFELDGYRISKGCLVQVPTLVAHYDEDIWGTDKHPASEFLAARHVKYMTKTDQSGIAREERVFAMRGNSGSYFPYGGGNLICPGRHFAKKQIMLTIATLVTRFDIEFVRWVTFDGSSSERPANNEKRFCGSGSVPPDRDMEIRLKRVM